MLGKMTTKDCDSFGFFFWNHVELSFLWFKYAEVLGSEKPGPPQPWDFSEALMVNVRLKQFRAGAIVGPSSFLQPLNLSGVPY